MMANKYVEQYIELVANTNKAVVNDLKKLIDGICKFDGKEVNDLAKMESNEIRSKLYKYLDYIDVSNAEIYTAKIAMNKYEQLAKRYASTMVQGDNFNIDEAGRGNGGSKHRADSKCIQLLEFQAEYQDACVKYKEYLAKKKRNTIWLKRIFDNVIPVEQSDYRFVLTSLYCDDYSSSEICKVLKGADVKLVHDYKYQGCKTIAKAIKYVLMMEVAANE